MFAGAGGGQSNLRVRNIRSANINDIDQRRFDDFLPIGGGLLPAQLAARGLDPGTVAAADGVHLDFCLEREEMRRLAPRIRMGLAHEAVPDHSDS